MWHYYISNSFFFYYSFLTIQDNQYTIIDSFLFVTLIMIIIDIMRVEKMYVLNFSCTTIIKRGHTKCGTLGEESEEKIVTKTIPFY